MVTFLEKSTGSAGFHPIIDFITRSHICYALTKKPEVCVSFIKQFWRSAEALTDDNGEVKIHATIDGHSLSITEGSLRRHLKLADQDGITSLPNSEIFEQLALMGYHTDSDKLTFQKGAFSPQWRFLIHNILHCLSPKKTAWEQFSSNIQLLLYNYIFRCPYYLSPSPNLPCSYPSPTQPHITTSPTQPSPTQPSPTQPSPTQPGIEHHLPTPHDSPLHVVHLHGSDEGSLKLKNLMNLAYSQGQEARVSDKDWESKETYRVVLSDDEVFEDDSSKQGRNVSRCREGSEKASDEVSTAGVKKGTASEEVPIVSTAEIARDEEIARQWDEEERKRVMDEAKSAKKIDWNDPSVIRYHTQKMKPKTVAQARRNMIKYLKNQGNYKISDFKGMSYNDIRPIFEKVWDFNQNIEPMDAEHGSGKQKSPEKSLEKSLEKSPEKMEEDDVVKEPGAKRKKSIPRKSTRKRQKLEEDVEKEELKGFLDIVPREEVPIEVEYISTKGDGSLKNYKILSEMLEDFDRLDVEELYRLVKNRYSASRPEGFDLMLWGDLHTLFEPDEDDEIWKDQHEYNLLSWRLYYFSSIHILLMENGLAIHMLTEKKYPLTARDDLPRYVR
ncbi:hypothetical protein Tco_0432269 [Tanacetum coccineum]